MHAWYVLCPEYTLAGLATAQCQDNYCLLHPATCILLLQSADDLHGFISNLMLQTAIVATVAGFQVWLPLCPLCLGNSPNLLRACVCVRLE